MSEHWRTDTVLSIARGMRQSGDFSALPILADAIQDDGFNDIGILNPRNDPAAGNWIVAFVLEEQEESRKWLQAYVDEINADIEAHESAYLIKSDDGDVGDSLTVDELVDVVKKHIETGDSGLGFGFDLPYGEAWMTDEKLEGLRKHAEVLLKATMTPKNYFLPFSCAC